MDKSLITRRVDIGLSKAKLTDSERRRKKKSRHVRFLAPVEPKSNVQFRPSLDHRMPTLGNNAVFCLRLNQTKTARLSQEHLELLETRPPRHLREIRSILSQELETVGKELIRLERKYYGIYRNLPAQLTKLVPLTKTLMVAQAVGEISSVHKVEEMFKKINENKEKFKDYHSSVTALRDITNKIKEYVPVRFSNILEHSWKVFNLLDKYCISFHNPDTEITVDTVEHYHEQILCWRETIIENLENVMKISRQVRQNGVHFQSMSANITQAGQHHHCSTIPVLLVFPQACANIRNTSYAMTSWIKADENYCDFLRNDVLDLEKKREAAMRWMREGREKFHSITYKLNQAECECSKLAAEVEQHRDKEDILEQDEQFLGNRCSEMQLEIDVKEYRRRELQKSAQTDPISLEMWEHLGNEVRLMKENLPFVHRQLSNVRYKLNWILGRRKALEASDRQVEATKVELEQMEQEKCRREEDYQKTEAKLEMARKIHMFKTSPGAVQKLFYGLCLDVSSSRVQGISVDCGPLNRACDVVSSLVEHDWSRMYRNLPFSPLRGQVTIENDIRNIGRESNRLSLSNHASRALTRWRRFHTRARVEDLMDCLKNIRRHDVINAVDLELNPPVIESSDEEDDNDLPVGPELVPFYRQIERYDRLRAAKKSQQISLNA